MLKNSINDSSQNNKFVKCYRCEKIGHIKKNYRVRFSKENIVNKSNESLSWEQYFIIEVVKGRKIVVIEQILVQVLFNCESYKQ